MRRGIDRHDWFAEYGDLISDFTVPKHAPDFPWPCKEEQAFYKLAWNKEDNDCSVRALAVACAAPYDKAHEAMRKAGRLPEGPALIPQMMDAARHLRCHMVRTTCTAKTLLTVEHELKNTHGGFIVSTCDHVVGVWNGELIDHTRGRLLRLDGIYRIEPLRSKTS